MKPFQILKYQGENKKLNESRVMEFKETQDEDIISLGYED